MSDRRPRHGAALVMVLLALALLATLAAAGSFDTVLRARGDRSAAAAPRSLAIAESLAVATLADWGGPAAALLAAGTPTDTTLSVGTYVAHVHVAPTQRGRYVLTARVDAVAAGARAGVWLAIRRDSLALPPLPAVGGDGAFDLLDVATVAAADRAPAGWLDCPPPDTDADAAAAGASVAAATRFDELWPHADVRVGTPGALSSMSLAPRALDGRCDAASPVNWGEPDVPVTECRTYAPVVAAVGSLRLSGGRGQGVLLVAGDLDIRGDAHFVGLVVVRGRATLADDARVVGALVVLDSAHVGSAAHDRASVARSECAVRRALAAAGSPRPDGAHAWAPLY